MLTALSTRNRAGCPKGNNTHSHVLSEVERWWRVAQKAITLIRMSRIRSGGLPKGQ